MSHSPRSIRAACALIPRDGLLFVGKRARGLFAGKWELIGGKIDVDETPSEAIVRELKEELHCDAKVIGEIPSYEHQYPEFHLTLYPVICELGDTRNLQSTDHSELAWVPLSEIMSYDFTEADYHAIQEFKRIYAKQKGFDEKNSLTF